MSSFRNYERHFLQCDTIRYDNGNQVFENSNARRRLEQEIREGAKGGGTDKGYAWVYYDVIFLSQCATNYPKHYMNLFREYMNHNIRESTHSLLIVYS